jgi:hypothetical protein
MYYYFCNKGSCRQPSIRRQGFCYEHSEPSVKETFDQNQKWKRRVIRLAIFVALPPLVIVVVATLWRWAVWTVFE